MYTETDIKIANMLLYGVASYFSYMADWDEEFQVKVRNKSLGEFSVSFNIGGFVTNLLSVKINGSEYKFDSDLLANRGAGKDKSALSKMRLTCNKAIRYITDNITSYQDGKYSTYLELVLLIIKYGQGLGNNYSFEDDVFGDLQLRDGKLFVNRRRAVLNFTYGMDLTQSLLELPFWSLEQVILIQGFSENQEIRYRDILNHAKEVVEIIQNLRKEDLS